MSTGSDMLLERVRAATADEYEIERELGRGGMAAVFLARDIALGRLVAIKVMRPELIDVAGTQDRFVIEARTAAQLDHPGIVSVYAVKQREGLLFIVMKYIEGRPLDAVLKRERVLGPATTAAIVARVAEALQFAHHEGIIHRDVKPSNIIIDTRGRPVVTDFGIARVTRAQSITVAGAMLGTPSYMSPEQCRGLPVTAASDQYSLGVTMYEMLTGRLPFTGTFFELLTAHQQELPPSIHEFVSTVDTALDETLMRMLAKNPEDRWESLADVAQRLTTGTTPRRQDDELRATLAFFPDGQPAATPLPSIAPPPRELSPWPTPVATPAPAARPDATPVRVSAFDVAMREAAGAGAGTDAGAAAPTGQPNGGAEVVPARSRLRPALLGSGALLLVAAAVVVIVSGQREARSARRAVSMDSMRRADTVTTLAGQPTPPAAVRDSTPTAAPAPLTPDSTPAATTVAAARGRAKRDSALDPARGRTSGRSNVAGGRPDSIAVECARLLERVSLGEKLTEAEDTRLKKRCKK